MTTEFENEEEHEEGDPNESPAVRNQRQRIRQLEREKRELEEAAREGRSARVALAVQDAKLDTSSKTVQKFLEHYDGPPTAEALKAAAVEWGLVPEQTQEQQQSAQGQEQMAAAMGGGQTGNIPPAMTSMGHQVEGTDAAMWEEFERAVASPGGFKAGEEVLAKYGHGREGWTGNHQVLPGR